MRNPVSRSPIVFTSLQRRFSAFSSSNGCSSQGASRFLRKEQTCSSSFNQQKRGVVFHMNNEKPGRITGYYVLYPDVPDETVENNVLLSNIASNQDWPPLAQASPKEFYEGTVRMLMEYGATTLEHMEHLATDKSSEKSFDNVLLPLLEEEYDCQYAFNTMLLKMLTDWPECHIEALRADIHHVTNLHANEMNNKLSNKDFHAALQEIYDKREDLKLNKWKIRLIEWYLTEIRSSVFSIYDEKMKIFVGSSQKMAHSFFVKYMLSIMCTNGDTVFTIPSKKYLKHAPPHALKLLAGKNDPETGPWRGVSEPASMYTLLKYCGDRSIRRSAWDNWVSKATFVHEMHYNNSVNIEEIRHHQAGLAKPLGFRSIAEHRLCNKMAGSPQTVRDFVTELTDRIRPVFLDRLQSWSAYAATKEMITGELQPYDLFYMCQREGEDHYNVDTLDLMNYFPFWPTFENTIEIVSLLLNLNFVNLTDSNLERCHPATRIYSVTDKSTGEHLGRLYIDPFVRRGKASGAWNVFLGRPANELRNLDKIVYFVGLANEPDESGNSMLHYTQLQSMLFSFGRAVQYLLSRSPYRDIAIPTLPHNASSFDAANLFPMFMQFFVNKPNLLLALSSPHKITGESLAATADATSLALSRSMLWETYRTLFWTDFDLTICEMEERRDKFWRDLYMEMYKAYFPFKRERTNHQPCNFTPIFGNASLMGMYYRKLWAEMLALDVHDTFFRESDERSTGERLKTTLLNIGDGEVQGVLYNSFQGRDPSIGAICDFYDPPAASESSQEVSAAV